MAFLNGSPIYFSPHAHIQEPDVLVTSWADVQRIVRAGKARKAFKIGDQLKCVHADAGILTWDIIGIDHDKPNDIRFTRSITLQLHDSFPVGLVQTHFTDGDTWKDSLVRYWLNTPDNEYVRPAVGGSVYAHSFIHNMDEEFMDVVGWVDKETRSRDGNTLDTTVDKFFLLACFEVFGTSVPWTGYTNYGVGEGTPYEYYRQRSEFANPTNGPDEGRIKYRYNIAANKPYNYQVAHGWGLRSPYGLTSDWAVFQEGNIGSMNATSVSTTATYVMPACCIY